MQYQREILVAAIRERGITYLAPSDAESTESFASEEDLIMAILNQPDPRLQLALVNLFILRPDLAKYVSTLVERIPPPQSLDLQTLYMAAVYLQRVWFIRLGLYLDNISPLPDLYSRQLELPPADERFGKSGLYALTEAWSARSPYPFDWLTSLNKMMDLFFEQLKMEKPLHESTPVG
jgi:hypothetical protein